MPNVFESLFHSFKTTVDNEPKPPLHTGEVSTLWVYYTAIKEFIRYEEIGLNTSEDHELKEMLTDALKMCESQAKRLETFLIKEGVPLPSLPAQKPKTEINAIPLGVKLNDDELANGVSMKLVIALTNSAAGQAQAVRTDVGALWLEFYLEMVSFGSTLKVLMRKRGWIRIPPYFIPPGIPK